LPWLFGYCNNTHLITKLNRLNLLLFVDACQANCFFVALIFKMSLTSNEITDSNDGFELLLILQ